MLEKVELLLDPVIQKKDTLLTHSTSFTSTSVPSPSDQSVFESASLPTFSEILPQEKNNSFQETVLPFNKNKENIITTETSQGPVTSYATLLSPNGKQHTTLSPLDYENESAKVIEEVKNTISGIIKEVVASNQNSSKRFCSVVSAWPPRLHGLGYETGRPRRLGTSSWVRPCSHKSGALSEAQS